MDFKKFMATNGSEMVKAAAKEAEVTKSQDILDVKWISEDKALKLKDEIRTLNGKVTTSVPISKIIVDENIRKKFSNQSLKELSESLKDVGLLHNVILHLVQREGKYYFHCVSGMRRILAAELIQWDKINSDIMLEQDPVESLYIGAIANLHEEMFWLDNALLYSKLFSLGHTDEKIANRVKVNVRTVGWFRRLANMSPACQSLAYDHPELFNSTWAQQVARHGDLPDSNALFQHMQQMIAQKRTWHNVHEEIQIKAGATSIDRSDAVMEAHRIVTNFKKEQLEITHSFLQTLAKSGFLTQSALKKIQGEFFKETPTLLQGNKSFYENET